MLVEKDDMSKLVLKPALEGSKKAVLFGNAAWGCDGCCCAGTCWLGGEHAGLEVCEELLLFCKELGVCCPPPPLPSGLVSMSGL